LPVWLLWPGRGAKPLLRWAASSERDGEVQAGDSATVEQPAITAVRWRSLAKEQRPQVWPVWPRETGSATQELGKAAGASTRPQGRPAAQRPRLAYHAPTMTFHCEKFRVGLVQMSMSADPLANIEKAALRVEEAAAQGAQVVCLPELYRSRYFCQREDANSFDLAETVPGPSTDRLSDVARRLGVAVVVPVFEKRAPGLYHNSAVTIDADGSTVGLYRKMHVPDDPAFYEKFYFAPGDLGFLAANTRFGRVGTLICWDQWYPEGARLTALRGAAILFYPTAIGWHPSERARHGAAQRDAWQTIQRGHAIANGCYVAAVNRVGHEPGPPGQAGLDFWGSSFLCDPLGVIIAEASTEAEEILTGDVELARIEEVRRGWPFLRDRRVDAYHGMEKRYLD